MGYSRSGAAGVGVSAAVGGGRISSRSAANGRVSEVSSGRPVCSAKATSPPSGDVNARMAEVARAALDAAEHARPF